MRANEPVEFYPEQFTAVVQLKVTGTGPAGTVTGGFRKTFHLRQDDDMMEGFPLYLDASGESSPKISDINGDGEMEIILATADGKLHAIDHNAQELPGFPLETPVLLAVNDDASVGPNRGPPGRSSAPFAPLPGARSGPFCHGRV